MGTHAHACTPMSMSMSISLCVCVCLLADAPLDGCQQSVHHLVPAARLPLVRLEAVAEAGQQRRRGRGAEQLEDPNQVAAERALRQGAVVDQREQVVGARLEQPLLRRAAQRGKGHLKGEGEGVCEGL